MWNGKGVVDGDWGADGANTIFGGPDDMRWMWWVELGGKVGCRVE